MHAYNPKATIACFDMARCNDTNWFPWNFMENIKNKWFTSTKYNGQMKWLKESKVVVFMNEMPPMDKLSKDRYDIFHVEKYIN